MMSLSLSSQPLRLWLAPASLEPRQVTALLAPTVKSQYEHMWIYVCNYKSALQEREMLCWTVLQISSLLLICCSLHYREVIGVVWPLSAHCCCPSKSDRILTLSKLKRFFFFRSPSPAFTSARVIPLLIDLLCMKCQLATVLSLFFFFPQTLLHCLTYLSR